MNFSKKAAITLARCGWLSWSESPQYAIYSLIANRAGGTPLSTKCNGLSDSHFSQDYISIYKLNKIMYVCIYIYICIVYIYIYLHIFMYIDTCPIAVWNNHIK